MDTCLMPADCFVTISKADLSDHNRSILTILYQPIIGSIAISLYFTLWSYIDEVSSISLSHHTLMNNMHLSLDQIKDARIKLEAMGLIKTYLKNESINSYVYLLYPPLEAYKFLNNPILNTTLYNNVGRREYERIIKHFKEPNINLKGYYDVSSKFNDVFESRVDDNIITTQIKENTPNDIMFKPNIDLNNVLSFIPSDILDSKSLIPSIKELIYKIAFIYNYSDEQISEIIRNSVDISHHIDKEKLKQNARKFYKFEHLGKLPTLAYKNQPEYLRKKTLDTSLKAKMIYTFDTTSPYEFLYSKNGNKPSKNDIKVLEMLILDFQFPPGVVNVLIDYILRINNKSLALPYVNAIASQWKRNNILTVEDAMNFASNEYNKKKTNTKYKKITKKPDWFDEVITENTATAEEIKNFEESLK